MITSRPWGLTPAEQAGVLRALRFRYFKWDTFACGRCLVLPESIVLARETHDRVVRAVEEMHRALTRFEHRVRGDHDALRRLGIPAPLHSLIAAETDCPLALARYDLFETEDGRLMISECNADVPGGFNEAVGIPDLLGTPGDGVSWNGDLRSQFADAFRPYDTVALLYATAFSEDLQHMLILDRWLSDAGHRTIIGSPAHLRTGWRGPRIFGVRVDAAFRFYPGEWMPQLDNLPAWTRVGSGLPMMNPLSHLIRQSKSLFALWREDAGLDADDRALVDRHCPWTETFDPSALLRLRAERDRWVLKRAFGRMGDAVVIGALVSDNEWEQTLAEAARAPESWCVQERFLVRAIPFESGPLYPAIGAFVLNGQFAGYYSRAATRPFITHQAYHVATLVQAA